MHPIRREERAAPRCTAGAGKERDVSGGPGSAIIAPRAARAATASLPPPTVVCPLQLPSPQALSCGLTRDAHVALRHCAASDGQPPHGAGTASPPAFTTSPGAASPPAQDGMLSPPHRLPPHCPPPRSSPPPTLHPRPPPDPQTLSSPPPTLTPPAPHPPAPRAALPCCCRRRAWPGTTLLLQELQRVSQRAHLAEQQHVPLAGMLSHCKVPDGA